VRAGAHFLVPDFINAIESGGDLMPMIEQVRRSVAWAARNAASFGGDPDRIYITGHSSGAHLGGCVLITDWEKDFGLPRDTVKGATLCSGMYDLKPARLSKRGDYVKFTDATEDALSAPASSRPHHLPGDGAARHPGNAGIPTPDQGVHRRSQGCGQTRPADRRRELQSFRDRRDIEQSHGPFGRAALEMMRLDQSG